VGSYVGSYVGRIAVRATGSCNITTATGTVQGVHVRYCRPLLPSAPAQRRLHVHERSGASSPGLTAGVSAPQMR
jgi:hypothetical protein